MATYSEIHYKHLRESGKILREALAEVKKNIRAGISTLELDEIAERAILDRGGEPAFKHFQGYKYTLCTSVNEESIHGIPRKNKILAEGDIISVDIGVRYPRGDRESMCTDSARTYPVGTASSKALALIEACKQCFDVAIQGLRAGNKVKDIGKKIEKFVDGRYGIIENFFGHGIGKTIHEGVLIPNFDVERTGYNCTPRLKDMADVVLKDGDIICIEPMINCGTKDVKTTKDGWTVVTADGELAAHHENTIIIGKKNVEIIT